MIVKPAPVVPGEKNRGAVPVRPLHHGVDQAGDVGLADADLGWRVLTDVVLRYDPGHGRQGTILGRGEELVDGLDVAYLAVLLDRIEGWQGVPNTRYGPVLRLGLAEHGVVGAVWLAALAQVVSPADVGLVQQVGPIGPGVIVLGGVQPAGRAIQG